MRVSPEISEKKILKQMTVRIHVFLVKKKTSETSHRIFCVEVILRYFLWFSEKKTVFHFFTLWRLFSLFKKEKENCGVTRLLIWNHTYLTIHFPLNKANYITSATRMRLKDGDILYQTVTFYRYLNKHFAWYKRIILIAAMYLYILEHTHTCNESENERM